LTADTKEQPFIERDHQLPAYETAAQRHSGLWIVVGIILLLILVLVVVMLWRRHDSAKKPKAAPPKINITTATATKGNIGVYLDEIGTVTPVYTDSITSQVDGLVIAATDSKAIVKPVQEAAVTVGPIHHRRDTYSPVERLSRFGT